MSDVTLPKTPPVYGPVGSLEAWRAMLSPIKAGETGWRPYAVQRVVEVVADGAWGPKTDTAVKAWQKSHRLDADGIVGPATQATMIREACATVDRRYPDLPAGLLAGYARAEGAGILAAVNWYTPPGAKPGVDCGVVQWRQTGPPFDAQGLQDAFDAETNLAHGAAAFVTRISDYTRRRGSLGKHRIVELAVLAHNAPFLSEQIVRNGRLTTPNAPAGWTSKPGGGHYTHEQWSHVYPEAVLQGVSY